MFQFMFMVQLLMKFKFFIQELWERKSLHILYECWRRAYHALLAQLFVLVRISIELIIIKQFFNYQSDSYHPLVSC
jgi:hypothetical protein